MAHINSTNPMLKKIAGWTDFYLPVPWHQLFWKLNRPSFQIVIALVPVRVSSIWLHLEVSSMDLSLPGIHFVGLIPMRNGWNSKGIPTRKKVTLWPKRLMGQVRSIAILITWRCIGTMLGNGTNFSLTIQTGIFQLYIISSSSTSTTLGTCPLCWS